MVVLRDGKSVGAAMCADMTRDEIVRWMIGESITHYFRERTSRIGEPLLEVQGLAREGVLQDITLRLHQGEIVGLWGLMGPGRTSWRDACRSRLL